jgi:hypothetical protein
MISKRVLLSLLAHIAIIAVSALTVILIAFYSIPHLPVSDKSTFAWLLRDQIVLDHEHQGLKSSEGVKKHILIMGSSVVERGVEDQYLDTLFKRKGLPYFCSNAGAGGSFANMNLVTFRALLEKGLHPDRVIYGTFLQEFNGKFLLHMNIDEKDTSKIHIKEKSLWNAICYGAPSVSSMFDAANFHIYIFALNDAFRRVQNPDLFQRLSFGVNMFPRDSNYQYNAEYLNDLKKIYDLCKQHHIPFALYNSPVRRRIESYADVPYTHKQEAYEEIERFAETENIPFWNFDKQQFSDDEFLDTYHLNAKGAHKMAQQLANKIETWGKGIIEQDVTNLPDGASREVKDSLVRTEFHF